MEVKTIKQCILCLNVEYNWEMYRMFDAVEENSVFGEVICIQKPGRHL